MSLKRSSRARGCLGVKGSVAEVNEGLYPSPRNTRPIEGPMRNIVLRTLLFAYALALYAGAVAQAETPGRVAALRAEYLRLRNNDPAGDSAAFQADWHSLLSRMVAALPQQQSGEGVSRARVYAGDTALRLYRATRDRSFLATGIAVLSPVADAFSAADERAEALVLLGDLELADGKGGDEAAALYRRAAQAGGPASSIAKQRLQGLKNGTFAARLPSADVAPPRLVPQTPFRQRWFVAPVVIDPGRGRRGCRRRR